MVMDVTWMILFVITLVVILPSANCNSLDTNHYDDEGIDECGLYMAPSAIPGAGLGMYSGSRLIKEGEHIVPDMIGGDVMIPTFEMSWHTGSLQDPENNGYWFLWDEYTWAWDAFYGSDDDITEPESTHVCSGGFGAIPNCDMALINIYEIDYNDLPKGLDDPHWTYRVDPSGVSSATSPGAGAFSIYHGRMFSAHRDIEPYSELYVTYGDDYFKTRDSYWFVPISSSYKPMDKLLKRYKTRLGGVLRSSKTESLESNLWNVVLDIRDIWQTRDMYALPGHNTTMKQIDHILENGGTKMKGYNATIKDFNWMKEHGQCLDNIMDGVSEIPHAGRGAFAKRKIKKDGIVAPSPLVHVPHRNVLDMYTPVYDETGDYIHRDVEKGPTHKQLILNYCFGHDESELLLCPYGYLTNLINHSPNPNTEVRWSNTTAMKHPEWLTQPSNEWAYEYHSGLAFDYVALRDIEPHEEITIDYGPEWEAAWNAHVKAFEADPPRTDYRSASELNEMIEVDIPIWPEQFRGVIMGIREAYIMIHGIDNDEHQAVRPYRRGIPDEVDVTPAFFLCRAIDKNKHSNTYTVEVYESGNGHVPDNPYLETFEETVKLILFDVPVDAFVWRDIPYDRNHHQDWSFRHTMGFKAFPDTWKTNVEAEEASEEEPEV